MGENISVIEVNPVPTIYIDDVLSAVSNGETVRVVYFEYRLIDGERVKVPVLEMVRPASSIKPGALAAMIEARRATEIGEVVN